MSTYYIPRKESDWLDENGGKEKLLSIVRDAMGTKVVPLRPVTREFCPHCNVRLHNPGQSPCWHCGLNTVVD